MESAANRNYFINITRRDREVWEPVSPSIGRSWDPTALQQVADTLTVLPVQEYQIMRFHSDH